MAVAMTESPMMAPTMSPVAPTTASAMSSVASTTVGRFNCLHEQKCYRQNKHDHHQRLERFHYRTF
jgi:hypothetical protein